MHRHRFTTPALISFLVLLSVASPALGQSSPASPDADAPSQALRSDPAPPVPKIALTADPLAIYFGRYGFSFELAPRRLHSLWISPAWAHAGPREGLSLELGWHIWPLGRGLDGLFLGPVAGIATSRGPGRRLALRGGAEAGYQAVWGALAVGLAVGVDYAWQRRGDELSRGPSLRVRLSFGWAYL
jgi:hypothetical protein